MNNPLPIEVVAAHLRAAPRHRCESWQVISRLRWCLHRSRSGAEPALAPHVDQRDKSRRNAHDSSVHARRALTTGSRAAAAAAPAQRGGMPSSSAAKNSVNLPSRQQRRCACAPPPDRIDLRPPPTPPPAPAKRFAAARTSEQFAPARHRPWNAGVDDHQQRPVDRATLGAQRNIARGAARATNFR